jgi:hypothetical protein
MRGRQILSLLIVALVPLFAGCGSKISEANYYRVQHGMTEDEVEDLLGPAHQERGVVAPATASATQPASDVKSKSWRRGGLTIHVLFENGVVTGRSAEGIPAEAATQNVNITPT